jgi:hypothetical protein
LCGGAEKHSVEHELEGGVWLSAEEHFRPKHECATPANSRLERGDAVFQVFLPPGPATSERIFCVEPDNPGETHCLGARAEGKNRTVVKEEIYSPADAMRQRMRRVHRGLQTRTGCVQ